MNIEIALGSMRMLSNMARQGFLDGLGISRADFDRLVGDVQWLNTDRNRMTTVFQSLVNASVDALGLPRFNLPAEYLAAGIVLFVHPVNVHAACIFSPPSRTAEDMGRMGVADPCTSEQLFALVCSLYSNPQRSAARAQFEKATGLALEHVVSFVSVSKK